MDCTHRVLDAKPSGGRQNQGFRIIAILSVARKVCGKCFQKISGSSLGILFTLHVVVATKPKKLRSLLEARSKNQSVGMHTVSCWMVAFELMRKPTINMPSAFGSPQGLLI
jgi:hypothetical protein